MKVKINGKNYTFYRTLKCSYSDKFNRAVKLAAMYNELEEKFDRIAERGNYVTEQARLAVACKMMMETGIRVGNEASAEGYMTKPHPFSKKKPEFVKTYGLTTLVQDHILVKGNSAVISFLGKKQVENNFVLRGTLAKQVSCIAENNLDTLFGVSDYDLTKFIKKHVGRQFTPKDFRTMRANMYASEKFSEICKREQPTTKRQLNAEIKELLEYVSGKLCNTPAVCKRNYIDDLIWDDFVNVRYN